MAGGTPRIVRGYGIYEQLKEYKPAVVLAVDGDGEQVRINVPDVRQKHARVMAALREVAWVRCDLLDKKGGLMFRHQRNADDREPAGELEDLPVTTRAVAELQGLMQILLRGQDLVLLRHQQTLLPVLEGHQKLVNMVMTRLEQQEKQIADGMAMNQTLASEIVHLQLAQAGVAPASEGDGEPLHSDRAIGKLLPALLRAALAGEEPAAKGKRKPKETDADKEKEKAA